MPLSPPRLARCISLISAAAVLSAATPVGAAVGDWAAGIKARVRLIAAGLGDDGRLVAGIEIRLPEGWKTYWRTPGEAGIAPALDLSGSRNLALPEVSFPVPHRVDDGYTITNVYTDRVTLPLSAVVPDATKNVFIVLGLDIGVCEVICVPDHVDVRLIVAPGENDREAAALLTAARAEVPGPAEPGVLAVDDVVREGGSERHPNFRFTVTAADPEKSVVFIEGPPQWHPGPPEFVGSTPSGGEFTVSFSRLAETPVADVRFRVTIVSGGRAVEQTIGLND
jgi:suppressor for copper-sensitivity B